MPRKSKSQSTRSKNSPASPADVVAAIQSKYGKESLVSMRDGVSQEYDTISTGSLALNSALGIGGWPRGRVVEVYGQEASGKTTLCLHAAAEAQAQGLKVAYIDVEHALDIKYAAQLGVDVDELMISQPDSGEQALDIADMLVRSGAFGVVVVDSIAALVPQAELEGTIGDSHVGLQARLMGQTMRKLRGAAAAGKTLLLFINQLRARINTMGRGPTTATTGGNALKYFASIRVEVRRIGWVKVGEEIKGNLTRVKVAKNKCDRPFREAEFEITHGIGIDKASELLDMAVDTGVVEQKGAWFAYGEKKVCGREATKQWMLSDPTAWAAIQAAVTKAPEEKTDE